ncbi:MAG: hypothetical protein B7X90_03985 [Novosphingobium sp. 17-62-19]|nr:MAG: hypothetical protein B7Y74_08340 [Novosphingobium sp. 35-62-5]OZA20998.1 MAG: hypothetical protein B7X90_03985 [Novosphingobium sp. 17-62-19]
MKERFNLRVTFDPAKRARTIEDRGLDFADAGKILGGPVFTLHDDRFDYPEPRFQTYGSLDGRLVMFVWTPIDSGVHVISMRKCNDREQRKFAHRLG